MTFLDVLAGRELSARQLGWTMSVLACITCSVFWIIVLMMCLPTDVPTYSTFTFYIAAVAFSFTQLLASTLESSPLQRCGNVITGMIYGEIGDDNVCMTVRRWTMFWFISPFLHSMFAVIFGLLFVFIFIGSSEPTPDWISRILSM